MRHERKEPRADLVATNQLVGSGEIAERLESRISTVHWWRRNDETFPRPVAVLGPSTGRPTYIWSWPDVETWARRTGRLPPGG